MCIRDSLNVMQNNIRKEFTMEKFKRICALIGVVLLLLLYLGTFIFSLMGSESAHMRCV